MNWRAKRKKEKSRARHVVIEQTTKRVCDHYGTGTWEKISTL